MTRQNTFTNDSPLMAMLKSERSRARIRVAYRRLLCKRGVLSSILVKLDHAELRALALWHSRNRNLA